ncbi:MAG: M20/M25/M40 family metallo-hydrolase [Candidatus Adiutrix sp.]
MGFYSQTEKPLIGHITAALGPLLGKNMFPQIVKDFLELVQIETHSRQERLLADVLTIKLQTLGFNVIEDKVGDIIGGNAGNLIATLPGDPKFPAILFSAHMDRVENHGAIKPIIDEKANLIKSDGTSILASDDVSGICAILDGVRQIKEANIPHGPIEVVFSVAEEVGLLGARYMDYSPLKSKMAYVIDCGGPVGTIINQAPTQYTFTINVYGKSAHAGIEPEAGLNAIKVAAKAISLLPDGRLSPSLTANFGLIKAGKATNIVCDLVKITGEARSTNPAELDEYLQNVKNVFNETAAEFSTTADFNLNLEYETFLIDENDEVIQLAIKAMKHMNLCPDVRSGGGGMDGCYINNQGIKAVGLSPGYTAVHTPNEQQPLDELFKCAQLVAEIIKQAAVKP